MQQPLAQRNTRKLTCREGQKGRAPGKSSSGIWDPLRLEEEGSRAGQGRGGHCGAVGTAWRPEEEVGPHAQGAHSGEHPEVCFWYVGVKLPGLVSLGEQGLGESVALRSADLGSNPSSVSSQLGDWASDFLLNLSISICKMGILIVSIQRSQ